MRLAVCDECKKELRQIVAFSVEVADDFVTMRQPRELCSVECLRAWAAKATDPAGGRPNALRESLRP